MYFCKSGGVTRLRDFPALEPGVDRPNHLVDKSQSRFITNDRDWSPVIIEKRLACLRSRPRTFAVFGRKFDCIPIRPLVTPASTSTFFAQQTKSCGLVVGRPVSFPLTFGVAQLISEQTRLGRRSNASFCAVFFLCRSLGASK